MAYLDAENWASSYDVQDLEYQNDFPNSIDCSKILDSLLDESQEDYYCNEDDERLNSLIQSLEAEIITTNSGKSFDGDHQSSCSSIEVDFMDMEDSSSSSNGDNFNLDNVESSTNIGSFDMLDNFQKTSNYYSSQMMCQRVPNSSIGSFDLLDNFEGTSNYYSSQMMMCQRVPFVENSFGEGTDESYV